MKEREEDNPELLDMESVVEISPTLRGRIIELIILFGISFYLAFLLKKIPSYGMYLDTMLGFKLSFLHIKLSYNFLAWPLRVVSLLSFFYGVYIVLQQKTTKYKLTYLSLEKNAGVFNRESNPIDLVKIKDHKEFARWYERPLGLSRLKVFSSDVTDPELLIKHITKADAHKMYIFIKKFAFSNYNEMRIAERREAERRNRLRGEKPTDTVRRNARGDVFIDDDAPDEQ